MAEAAPDRALVAAQHVVALFASAASPSAECVQALTDLMRNAMCVALVVVDTPTAPLLQTCVYLDPPSSWTILLGRGAGEPDARLMASRLMQTKTGVVLRGGASQFRAFGDLAQLAKVSECTAAVCLPLLGPSGAAFGALSVGFPAVTPADAGAVQGALDLCAALVAHCHRQLVTQASDISRLLFPAPLHGATPAADGEWDANGSEWSDEDVEDEDEDGDEQRTTGSVGWRGGQPPSGPAPRPLSLRGRVAAALRPPAGSRPLLLTFRDPSAERAYVLWSAAHMHTLDLAALATTLANLMALGLSPGFSLATRHPRWWAAAFAAPAPLTLALAPATRQWYRAHREWMIATCLLTAVAWHCGTRNMTTLMGADFFCDGAQPAAHCAWSGPLLVLSAHVHRCLRRGVDFSWITVNLLMFQLRFCWAAPLAAASYVASAAALLPAMCAAWEPDAVPRCVMASAARFWGAFAVAGLILRLAELRMRRLYLRGARRQRAE